MIKNNIIKVPRWVKVFSFFLVTLLPFHTAQAKTVKPIAVSDSVSYTDHIALTTDATDKDLMVKFQFNEQENTLTVSLISYRTLFVFWEDTRYKGTIKRRWLRTDHLPYVVTADDTQCFRLTKHFRKSLPHPHKSHIFKKWISYEGLQPREQELKMVNDYIEQTFDIQNKRNNVTVRLRDVMLLDLTKKKGINTRYEISYGEDLDLEYQVTIQRNPCFGLDEQLAAAQNTYAAFSKSYSTFKKRYGKGTVSSEEGLKAFHDLKATLTAQFPRNEDNSPCPAIQQIHDRYNLMADSLAKINVTLDTAPATADGIFDAKDRVKYAKVILANARQIDNLVANWLNSHEEIERSDLSAQCRSIIKDTNTIIKSSGTLTAEERRAVTLFRQAENYFNKTCK